MRSHFSARRRAGAVIVSAAVIAGSLLLLPGTGSASATTTDPLQQTLSASEPTVTDQKVFDEGHIDIGPRYQDGKWSIQVHSGVSPSAEWRDPADAVLRVVDASKVAVPDDPTYEFLHTSAGTKVAVIPQTQQSGVVWVGWNTQDPTAMEAMKDGVTMSLHGVQGPGDMVVYLQSGALGAPQVLWDSTAQMPQDLFVDTNSHTHANWVFTKPGVYLVDMEIRSTLRDGTTVTDTEPVRFAVGDNTSTAKAFSAKYTGTRPTASASPAVESGSASNLGDAGALGIGVGAGVLALLLVVIVIVALRGARARRRARATSTSPAAAPSDTGSDHV